MNEFLKLEIKDFVAEITLSKAPLNIFEIKDLIYLEKTLANLDENKNLKLIVIKSDQKAFSAGVSISCHAKDTVAESLKTFHKVFYRMLELNTPTLALVQGGSYGGGCELALFCDFILASESAVFSQPEINLGCYPPVSIASFPQFSQNKKILELILTGNSFSAKEMLDCGLINNAFKNTDFEAKTKEFIEVITNKSSSVLKTTLKAYKQIHYKNIKENIQQAENIYLNELIQLQDADEGLKSFMENRKPIWKNN